MLYYFLFKLALFKLALFKKGHCSYIKSDCQLFLSLPIVRSNKEVNQEEKWIALLTLLWKQKTNVIIDGRFGYNLYSCTFEKWSC